MPVPIILLGLVSFLTDVSTEMVYPLLPLYLTQRLGAGPAIVGLIEGIAESLASLLNVFSGYLSDRVGKRKPLAIAGYSSSLLGKVFLYFSGSWGGVLLGRVGDRFGKGIRTAPRDALIAEHARADQRGRAFGLHRALDTAGAVVGVALAHYFLTTWEAGYRRIFLFSLAPALLGVAILTRVREKGVERREKERDGFSIQWQLLDKRLKLLLLIVFLFALGNSTNQFLLLRASSGGFPAGQVLLLYLVFNLTHALVSYPAGRLADRLGKRSVLIGGYFAYGLVYLGFALVKNPTTFWLLFATYGVYMGLTEGVQKAAVADFAPAQLRATFMGALGTVTGAGLFLASFLAGVLWQVWGPAAPFFFGSGMGFLAALLMALTFGKRETGQVSGRSA